MLEPLDEAGARRMVRTLLEQGVESIAVCLVNSYANPAHELALKRLIAEEAPGLPISISFEVLPQIREYERTSTTVTNAYVKPLTGRYLGALSRRLDDLGFAGRLFVTLSSGGVIWAATAAELPERVIESGPTAAVIASQYRGRLLGISEMLCFDMGGTTAPTRSMRRPAYPRGRSSCPAATKSRKPSRATRRPTGGRSTPNRTAVGPAAMTRNAEHASRQPRRDTGWASAPRPHDRFLRHRGTNANTSATAARARSRTIVVSRLSEPGSAPIRSCWSHQPGARPSSAAR